MQCKKIKLFFLINLKFLWWNRSLEVQFKYFLCCIFTVNEDNWYMSPTCQHNTHTKETQLEVLCASVSVTMLETSVCPASEYESSTIIKQDWQVGSCCIGRWQTLAACLEVIHSSRAPSAPHIQAHPSENPDSGIATQEPLGGWDMLCVCVQFFLKRCFKVSPNRVHPSPYTNGSRWWK